MKRVSHQDIASHLGLSQSAVSRGLHDDPSIPPSTRKRIRAACEDLGYRPNSLLSELAAARWQTDKAAKGTVVAYIVRTGPQNAIGFEYSSYVRHYAELLGYQLETFFRFEFPSSAKLQRVLRNRGITDVILGPVHEEKYTVQLDWSKFICVQILPGFFPLRLHSVVKNHFASVVVAWQKAVSYGYSRIGIILMEHRVPVMDDVLRRSAVYACQRELFSRLPRLKPLHSRVPTPNARVDEFGKWVEVTKPDVIIGFSPGYHGLFTSLFHRNIPYIDLAADSSGQLSGIIEGPEVFAKEGMNLLHFCHRTGQWGIPDQRIDHVIEPQWFEGNSLPRKEPLSRS